MFVIGSLFESRPITCVRYAKVEVRDQSNQMQLIECFVLSSYKTILFYDKEFKELSRIAVDETLVQLEFLECHQNRVLNSPQIALVTFDHKLFICDLLLTAHVDDNEMQLEAEQVTKLLKVNLKVQQTYDFKDEVKMNQNYNTKITNYFNYLIMDTQHQIMIFQEGGNFQASKQKGWSISQLPYDIVLAYTKKGPEIVKADSETRIKLIDCAKFDYVVLVLLSTILSSQVILYGIMKEDGIRQEPIKHFNLGVSIDSIHLINKNKPLYLCRSILEECFKIYDLNSNTIVKTIDVSFDINNVYPLESCQDGIISNSYENIKFSYDKDYNFSFITLNAHIELSGCVGNETCLVLTSHLDDSLVIKDNEIVKLFKNVGPISHLQDVRLNQRNIFITSFRKKQQLHRYRKGINVKRVLISLPNNQNKQTPKNIFFIDDSLIVMSFNECSKFYKLDQQGLRPIENHNYISIEQTLLFVKNDLGDILQVTKSAIMVISAEQGVLKEKIATGVNIIYADYCHSNQSLILVDHQQFVYTVDFEKEPYYLNNNGIQIPGCLNTLSLSQNFNILAVSILFQNNILYFVNQKGELQRQQLDLQGKSIITSLLFQDAILNIALNNGLIQQYTIDEKSCVLRFKKSIRVCEYSYISLIKYQNKFFCISLQIQLVDGDKLVDINWDNVEWVSSSEKLIIARMKNGNVQVVQLDDEESQQCTASQNLGEKVLFLNHTTQHYFSITNSHIDVYENTNHRQIQSFKHDLKVFNSRVYDDILFLCGQNLNQDIKKQGCLISINLINQSFQFERKYCKTIIKDFLQYDKNVWILQTTKVKCYNSIYNNQRPVFFADFQINLNGFDVIQDYLLIYDEIKGVGVFKYDLVSNKLVGWSQYYMPVLQANFLGEIIESPTIICFGKDGIIQVVNFNQLALGISDKMNVLFQYSQSNGPIFTTIVNERRNQLLFGSLFGQVGFVLYIEKSQDYQSLIEFQKIMYQEQGNFFFNKKNFHDFIDYDVCKKIKLLSDQQLESYLKKMVQPIKPETVKKMIEYVENQFI